MKLEISNGYVVLKDAVDRKTMKLYRKALFSKDDKVSVRTEGEEPTNLDMSIEPMDAANDFFVKAMVSEVVLDGLPQEITMDLFDSMDTRDFDLILEQITKMIKRKEAEKKSS